MYHSTTSSNQLDPNRQKQSGVRSNLLRTCWLKFHIPNHADTRLPPAHKFQNELSKSLSQSKSNCTGYKREAGLTSVAGILLTRMHTKERICRFMSQEFHSTGSESWTKSSEYTSENIISNFSAYAKRTPTPENWKFLSLEWKSCREATCNMRSRSKTQECRRFSHLSPSPSLRLQSCNLVACSVSTVHRPMHVGMPAFLPPH